MQNSVGLYEKPTAHVGLRLPPRIAEQWKSAAKSQSKTLSDWLRAQIHDLEVRMAETKIQPRKKREIIKTYQEVDPSLIRELGRIGNNLNQIAHQVNRASLLGESIQVVAFLMVLNDMQQELRIALQSIRHKHSIQLVAIQDEDNGYAH